MEIVTYRPEFKKDFIELNEAWISSLFKMEEEDYRVLYNFEEDLEKGAQIFFAVENVEVLACSMIAPIDETEWELEKFAARGMYTGTGAGTACLLASIEYAWGQGAKKISIVSNRKCDRALRLYEKYGFKEIPLDREKFPFERADVSYELILE